MERFQGVMPALVTPLNADETVNLSVLAQLIEALLSQGADGFYVGGATGEGINLTPETRRVLAEESVRLVNHRKPCIVHIAAAQFSQAVALAKHAEACGADGISAIPPLFFKYDADDIYQYYKTLADAVHIPLMIYYNPAAGFQFNAEIAARLFEVDNITSIKWTSSDYYNMMRLKDLTHGEMNVINGPDEMLLMGLAAGADGGIGTTYNAILPIYRAIYDSFRAGDLETARNAQIRSTRFVKAMQSFVTIPVMKVILEEMGYAVGNASFPMKRYTDEDRKRVVATFRAAGFEF